MLQPKRSTAAAVLLLCLSISRATGSGLDIALPLAPGSTWIVTIGGYAGAEPSFPGARSYAFAISPIIDIYRAGDRAWLTVPTDAHSLTLYSTGNFRAGVAADYIFDRNHHNDSALHGLPDIGYTLEVGTFVEYYPLSFLRTRIEVLQGITGADGLEAKLMADYILTPDPNWLFTLGPRLEFVNTQYASTFFSISTEESGPSGLPAYHASGGLYSAGIAAAARYYINDCVSVRAFAEWDRLLDGAADSPLVRLRGSENQFEFGVGAAYRFTYSR